MEYNTKRGDMQFREYGRNIEKMIEFVCGVPDGDDKNQAARALVMAMGQVGGMSTRDEVSLHKLWDHLMIMSNFQLESSWPFSPEELDNLKARVQKSSEKPTERLPYKNSKIERRHYGAYLEAMMRQLKETPDGAEYNTLATLVAQQAKRAYLVWNGELSDDNIIVDQIAEMSGDGRVTDNLKDKGIFVAYNTLPTDNQSAKKKKKKK